MRKISLVEVFAFASFVIVCNGQVCAPDTFVGLNPPDNDVNSNVGTRVNAVLLNNTDYRFLCCGYIDQWQLRSRDGITPGVIVKGQVWVHGTPQWELTGQSEIQVNVNNGTNTVVLAAGSRVLVDSDHVLGFYEPSGPVVTSADGLHCRASFFASDQTSFNWDGLSYDNSQEYSINARIQPSITPTFTNLPRTVWVSKLESDDHIIYTVSAADADIEDDGLLEIIEAGSDAPTFFEFNTSTHHVTVRSGSNLIPGVYNVTLAVSDPCSSAEENLTVVVENDIPVLSSLDIINNHTIHEDTTSETLLHELIVVDSDPTSCRLVTTGVPFEVKPIPGGTNNFIKDYGLYVQAGAASVMDYDIEHVYRLVLACNDTYDVTYGTFTVYLIRNKPPVIYGLPTYADVHENTFQETVLYAVNVTDDELDTITCEITEIIPNTSVISLRPTTNVNIYEMILQANANLQYDQTRRYQVHLQCSDHRRSTQNFLFVNVLRNLAPVFHNLPNSTFVHGPTSYSGELVFNIDASDPEDSQLHFRLECTSQAICPVQLSQSGMITLTTRLIGQFVPVYDFLVYVSDGELTTGPSSLTVHISDINNVPVILNLPLPAELQIPENSPLGTSVFQVHLNDNDVTDTHSFSLSSIPSEGSSIFEINATTGLVTTSSSVNIDFESLVSETFVLTVVVTDSENTASENFTVTITDVNEAPAFIRTSYSLTVDEGPIGTLLPDPSYQFRDPDTNDTHTFFIVCRNRVPYFSINPTNGIISFVMDVNMDAQAPGTFYICDVSVFDGYLTDTAVVTISVTNINDNTPIISPTIQSVEIDRETPLNTVITIVNATDNDNGGFGILTLSLDQSSYGRNTFGIDSNGEIYIQLPLSGHNYGDTLTVIALATDSGGLQASATVYVMINQPNTLPGPTPEIIYLTFWDYPANAAWVLILISLGCVICVLPCIVIALNVLDSKQSSRVVDVKPQKDYQTARTRYDYRPEPDWQPWKWWEF